MLTQLNVIIVILLTHGKKIIDIINSLKGNAWHNKPINPTIAAEP